jgi:hypothetical protein
MSAYYIKSRGEALMLSHVNPQLIDGLCRFTAVSVLIYVLTAHGITSSRLYRVYGVDVWREEVCMRLSRTSTVGG